MSDRAAWPVLIVSVLLICGLPVETPAQLRAASAASLRGGTASDIDAELVLASSDAETNPENMPNSERCSAPSVDRLRQFSSDFRPIPAPIIATVSFP